MRARLAAALHEMDLALGEPRSSGLGANGVGRFGGEQRLVPRNEVNGQQLLLEVGDEGVGVELQRGDGARGL
ncbi:MAG: hypothetical protein WDO56_31375 [Gammaproteobacteria bacterium]